MHDHEESPARQGLRDAAAGSLAHGRAPQGTLTIGNAEPPSSDHWDPHAANGLADNQIWSLVYDTLVTYDAGGRLVGGLARKWYRTGPTRLRVELRAGVRFSDGTPLSAHDVKASLERIGDPLSRLVLAAKVVPGLRVEVLADELLEIVTPKPFGPIERALAIAAIVPVRGSAPSSRSARGPVTRRGAVRESRSLSAVRRRTPH